MIFYRVKSEYDGFVYVPQRGRVRRLKAGQLFTLSELEQIKPEIWQYVERIVGLRWSDTIMDNTGYYRFER